MNNRILSFVSILSLAALTGNMLNIGLSYAIHWASLSPQEFSATFQVDFPLLLAPTLLPYFLGFIGTLLLAYRAEIPAESKRLWKKAFYCLLFITLLNASYHLPANFAFLEPDYEPGFFRLSIWTALHWVRVILSLVASVFALRGLGWVR